VTRPSRVIPRPIFSTYQTTYSAVIAGDVAKVEITPTAFWPNHKAITINAKPVRSGGALVVDLGGGENKFDIAVTSEKGLVRTYTIVITRSNEENALRLGF